MHIVMLGANFLLNIQLNAAEAHPRLCLDHSRQSSRRQNAGLDPCWNGEGSSFGGSKKSVL